MKHTRRSILKGCIAVQAAGLAGCNGRSPQTETVETTDRDRTPPATEETESQLERIASRWGFEDVLDLSSVGADPTGGSSIHGLLAEHLGPDTLVYLPPGEFRLSDTVTVSDVDRVGIVGPEASIMPDEGNTEQLLMFGWPDPVGTALCIGVDFDYLADNTGGRPILARASDSVLLESVSVTGEADVDEDLIRVDVLNPSGRGIVRDLQMLDGAPADTRVTGCQVGDNRGDLWFVDCRIDGFPDNGLYADPPEGSVHVIGGRYRNNGVANVRIETSDRAVVRGVHVRCDDATGGGANMRGIRLRAGESILVEDCFVELLEVTTSDGAIVFSSELSSATVRNCRIRVDADGVNAIRLKSAADERHIDGPFTCEGVSIEGQASGGAVVQAANRSGVSFSDLCIRQMGTDRDGFKLQNIVGEVRDTSISVTGIPFDLEGSTLERQNVTVGSPSDNGTTADFHCVRDEDTD
ncbi:hypothetical protein [Halobaculum magnesiiphilum]|uniref:Right handed beta helix region n=1 Tax=Halobaculum magnesiiphilum TaxID=1017351 RepID=A0A8T8WIY3_9EURY|nr:hypothetical protein [Halobaculum magnesiiphilum]QZP39694.1 hypothetical protein K6T50_17075 [Halobaculum magnesiiphilum]